MIRPRVVVIVQPDDRTTLPALASADLAGVAFLVHLRFAPEGAAWEDALRVRARMRDVPFVVSAADAHGLDGVHLGGSLRAQLGAVRAPWISVPAHDDDELLAASRGGATAAYVSPIFATPGKGAPRGVEALRRARALAPELALYALGGVDASNAEACAAAGADGVAVIRSVAAASSPVEALRAIDDAVRRGGASRSASWSSL